MKKQLWGYAAESDIIWKNGYNNVRLSRIKKQLWGCMAELIHNVVRAAMKNAENDRGVNVMTWINIRKKRLRKAV